MIVLLGHHDALRIAHLLRPTRLPYVTKEVVLHRRRDGNGESAHGEDSSGADQWDHEYHSIEEDLFQVA